MNQINAMIASAIQQWKNISLNGGNLALHLASVPMAAVITYIAMQKGDPATISFLLVGLPLMTVWSGVVYKIGYTINNEMSNQVLQFAYISRTPLILISLGKAAAQVVWGLPTGLVSLAVVYLMARTLPQVAEIAPLLISLLFVIIGIAVASLFFSPLVALVGGPTGWAGVIILLGNLLGGFIFPVDSLPVVLSVLARIFPTSWAMDAVWSSIRGDGWPAIINAWGMSTLTSLVLFGITYLMFRTLEKRLRIEGIRDVY